MARLANLPAPTMTLVEVLDRFTREVRFARGLVAAIHGLRTGNLGDLERAGIEELAAAHVEHLEELSDEIARLCAWRPLLARLP
jgi:hypothetical protein